MTDSATLSVVIPSYNARALLARALRTLAEVAPRAEVIVVDGESADGSAEMVEREFPAVVLVRQKNHGFAHATNRGIERATRPFILLMNSDLFLTRDALDAMFSRLEGDRAIGAVGPRLVNEDGSRQAIFGPYYWPNWVDVRKASRVWLLSGACIMTRRDVLERVGALDESFFLYNEEYDWCARCQKAGYYLELLPETVVHVGGGSTAKSPELILEAHRGFLYVTRKHTPSFVAEAIRRGMILESLVSAGFDRRPAHRSMWLKLASLAHRRADLESPFPVSGRGSSVARPNGLALPLPTSGLALDVEGRRASHPDESGTHALERASELAAAGRLARPANVLPLRRAQHRKPRTRRAAL